jgi:squalene synthase HpnC
VGPTGAGTSSNRADLAAGQAGDAAEQAADEYLREREHGENFPVALRLLPRRYRSHLVALYDVARVIDDLGDQAAGDRTAQLLAFRADLARIWAGGTPEHPALRRLAPSVAACDLPEQQFQALVEANLRDQTVNTYPTWDDLLDYCTLSANPVGRLVLAVFGATDPDSERLSDRICSALQVIEHCQDVGEDRRAGRIYLPAEDLARFGVAPQDLDAGHASHRLRALVRYEADRAARLLRSGEPLLGRLHGWARVAVTGYVAGGYAALDGLRHGGWGVLPTAQAGTKVAVLGHALRLTIRRRSTASEEVSG